MSKESGRSTDSRDVFETARDELYSHILRCGVIDATEEQRVSWFDDTMEYLGERFHDLSEDQLKRLRDLGERFCKPVIPYVSN